MRANSSSPNFGTICDTTHAACCAAKGVQNRFVVQHATDPASLATISAPTPSTRTRLTQGGAAPGANVSFRVAAIDPSSPTGRSPWSAWVTGNAR